MKTQQTRSVRAKIGRSSEEPTDRCNFKIDVPHCFASGWNKPVSETVFHWTSNRRLQMHNKPNNTKSSSNAEKRVRQ